MLCKRFVFKMYHTICAGLLVKNLFSLSSQLLALVVGLLVSIHKNNLHKLEKA